MCERANLQKDRLRALDHDQGDVLEQGEVGDEIGKVVDEGVVGCVRRIELGEHLGHRFLELDAIRAEEDGWRSAVDVVHASSLVVLQGVRLLQRGARPVHHLAGTHGRLP